MILDCYQCSSCYFEDKKPSRRIKKATVELAQPKIHFTDVLLVFACIELYDDKQDLEEAVKEFVDLGNLLVRKRLIVLCPNAHLSIDRAPEKQAKWLIRELEKLLITEGFDVRRLSFGRHKEFGMECNGNVASVVGRRFYGSAEKQFLRLLTRLGVCPPESLPDDMPPWAKILTERRLKVLGSRRETYNVAKKMFQDQLDITGGELWTCMLFEGERKPMEDYLSLLYRIIEEFPDVKVHRALNLSIPDFARAAQSLFHKYPKAIKSERLRIYNSQVSDIEFLLTRTAVLLAFPHKPERAKVHAGDISFGIYCPVEDFAKNLIQWYETFLVDTRFGRIRTESELNAVINELE